jgi:hypothetical protein
MADIGDDDPAVGIEKLVVFHIRGHVRVSFFCYRVF